MKTIGLLGGMSWVSTELYYRCINKAIAAALGGAHSARCVTYSFDFADIEALQARHEWDAAAQLLGNAGRALRDAGADFLVLCTNTMHLLADDVEHLAGIPLLHIGDTTAAALNAAGISRAALLGTRYTMEQPFLRERLERSGVEIIVPNAAQRTVVHDIIYGELIRDIVSERSRAAYLDIIDDAQRQGAQGIILGCTEVELLITADVTAMPLFQTAKIHAQAAASHALAV